MNSRFVWTFPITNKRATTTANALQSWLKHVTKNYKTIPKSLNSDDGSEFKGAFKKLLKVHNNEHFVSIGEDDHHDKEGIVERFHRTLRNLIQRYLNIYNTKKYVDILPQLIDNYNNTYHGTLKATPHKVLTGKKQSKQRINRAEFIPIGNKVRTLLKRGKFAKGSKPY